MSRLAADFAVQAQPAVRALGQLCLLWPSSLELPVLELPEDFSAVLAQPFRQVRWFQLLLLLLLLLLLPADFPSTLMQPFRQVLSFQLLLLLLLLLLPPVRPVKSPPVPAGLNASPIPPPFDPTPCGWRLELECRSRGRE